MTNSSLNIMLDKRVLIVGGSGGVGKTSISAALGIRSAMSGSKTLVLTIDPARRLANALGISGIGDQAVKLNDALAASGLKVPGELHIMMLDVENTLNRMVRRVSSDPARQAAILANPMYQNIASRLSGSQEYASMQRLHEIVASGVYERVILDTPPSTHALDFLSAPKRLMTFFDLKVIQALAHADRTPNKPARLRIGNLFLSAIQRLSGAGVVRDIAEFLSLAEPLVQSFQQQAGLSDALLRDHQTGFVIVSGPTGEQLNDAGEFREHLQQLHIATVGFIVNRHLAPLLAFDKVLPEISATDSLPERILQCACELEQIAREQTRAIKQFSQQCDVPLITIPMLHHAPDSLRAIAALGDCFTGVRH